MIVVLKVSIETGMLPVPQITIVVNVKFVTKDVKCVMVQLGKVIVSLVMKDITYKNHSKLPKLVVLLVNKVILLSKIQDNVKNVSTHVLVVSLLKLMLVLVVKLHTP